VLAVCLRVLIPQGMMISQTPGAFPLVICSGHGPELFTGLPDGSNKGQKSTHDSPCAFAGHVVPTPPTAVELAAPNVFAFAPGAEIKLSDLAPGRGLAAPPPPSRGPPSRFL
jgi:hypothetical protein